ncbi:MAG: nickel pincer cofactor-dependent isomerase, group 22 [Anaerolineae bacterium]
MRLPRFRWVEQRLFADALEDIPAAVSAEMLAALPRFRPGARVAVTAGSRGVSAIHTILRAVCVAVRARGGDPYLVPAMGSHGGGTAAGQLDLLASLGVTEASVGAPILSSMETVVIGDTLAGIDVHLDLNASKADAIVLVERIKPHTDFTGRYESGLAKMMAIGLGKKVGAMRIHSYGVTGLRDYIPQVAETMLAKAPVVAGLAILENGVGRTWRVVGVPAAEIMAREPGLLQEVKSHAAGLPFRRADLLIVDYVGKEISGTGMDTKVIGRMRIAGEPEPERPHVSLLAALDLTEASHGNGIGIGLADFTTERFTGKVVAEPLRANAIASGFWERSKVPVALASDQATVETAMRFHHAPVEDVRICRIRDTAYLERFVVSEALAAELDGDCTVGEEYSLEFDDRGDLIDHEAFAAER